MAELRAFVPAQGTAATVQDQVVGECEHAGTVSSVSIVPEANVAADATNNRTYRLVNKGQSGAGSTLIASHQTTTGGALTAFDEKALTLSGTAANLLVAAGDILAADETVTGTGQTHAGYTIKVQYAAAP
jgi:hypothetical protein